MTKTFRILSFCRACQKSVCAGYPHLNLLRISTVRCPAENFDIRYFARWEPGLISGMAACLAVMLIVVFSSRAVTAEQVTVRDNKGAESRVKDIMAMSEKYLLAMVPDQCPDVMAACPKCKAYMRTMKAHWKWNYKKPFEIQCPKCGTVYPNKNYPMDKTAAYLNFVGEEIKVPYYDGPKPRGEYRGNKHPEHYFFEAEIDNQQYRWISSRVIPGLVNAYKVTGKEKYSRRLALLLDKFAQYYPHYLLHRGRGINGYYVSTGGPCMVNGKKKGTPGKDLPYGWTDGKGMKCWISEINNGFVDAYGATKDSAAIKKISAEMGVDVAKRIENGLLREMVDFVMLMPWDYQMSNNLCGYFASIAKVGKVIGEPEYVHIAYRYINNVILDYGRTNPGIGYTFDLHHPEGNQGHYGVMLGIYGIFTAIEGYSDPPGYKGKYDGLHLENVSMEKDLPLFAKMIYVPEVYTLPNGNMNPLNDTVVPDGTAGFRPGGMFCPPLKESRCRILPGLGHVVLGDGRGAGQVQVQLQFSEQGANHAHQDCLGLVWFARGREMSGDIGYQRNKLRRWATEALSHNTVIIDRTNQNRGDTFGNLLLYIPDLPGLSLVQVDGKKAYSKLGAKLYRRTLILNTSDPDVPYFVDIFEVEGGSKHDYAIHGSVLGDMKGDCSLAMKNMPGDRPLLEDDEKWIEPGGLNKSFYFPGSLYGLFHDMKKANATEDFNVTFACKDEETIGTRIHMLQDDNTEVFLGKTPALRKAGHYKDELVYKWQMPHLIVRRTGDAGLKSVFVAVYDMFKGGPKITEVARIDAGENVVALTVKSGSKTDTLLFSLDEPKTISAGGVQMNGRFGLVCEKAGKADAYLVGGTKLKKGNLNLSAKAAFYEGTITSATRKYDGDKTDSFVTSARLPLGTALRGSWMIVTHGGPGEVTHGYEIDSVERKGYRTVIHLTADYGLKINGDSTKEIFSQWRTFKGENCFVIYTRAASVAKPFIEPNTGPWDRLKMGRFIPFVRNVKVTLGTKGGKGEIRYTTDGSEPTANSKRYRGPFVLKDSATVKAIVPNNGGIQAPRVAEQFFQRALVPPSGVLRTEEVRNPQSGLTYKNIYGGKIESEGVVENFSLSSKGSEKHFEGFIKVPRDGIYMFYAKASAGCVLTIGDIELLDTVGLGHFKEWDAGIALRAGLHPIKLKYRYGSGRVPSTLSVKYKGPGIDKQPVLSSILKH